MQWLAALAGLQKAPQVWKLKSPFRPELQLTLAAAGAAGAAAAAPAPAAPAAATSSAVVPLFFFFFFGGDLGGSWTDGAGCAVVVAATGAASAAAFALAQNAQDLHLQNCGARRSSSQHSGTGTRREGGGEAELAQVASSTQTRGSAAGPSNRAVVPNTRTRRAGTTHLAMILCLLGLAECAATLIPEVAGHRGVALGARLRHAASDKEEHGHEARQRHDCPPCYAPCLGGRQMQGRHTYRAGGPRADSGWGQ